MSRRAATALLLTGLALAPAAEAQTLSLLLPAGGTRGTDVDVRCYGRRLKDVEKVVWHRPGIEVLSVEADRDDRCILHLRVPEGCELGAYPFQLHTRRGLSRPKAFHVGALPSVPEADEHGTREQAQEIALDTTVDGRIQREEQDWFSFDVAQGQVVRIEAEGIRLGFYDFDLQVEVFDPTGELVLRADDSPLGRADPMTWFRAEDAGRYTLALREVAWGGSSLGVYRLHVGTFPRPVGAFPSGGRPGATVTARLVGDGGDAEVELTMPRSGGVNDVFPVVDGKVSPTPIQVYVSGAEEHFDDRVPDEPPAKTFVLHGLIGAPGETDAFPFAAEKGERLTLRVLARTLGSPLDPVVFVRDSAGKVLSSNDDSLGLDGQVRFTPPADGTYELVVRDHLRGGGPSHFYRAEVSHPRPPRATGTTFVEEAVPGRRPEDLGLAVPRGGRAATVLGLGGLERTDEITIDLTDLPPGVEAVPMVAGTDATVAMLVLRAAADAPFENTLATPRARAEQEPHERNIRYRDRYPPLRIRNNIAYGVRLLDALPVAVTEPLPFAVDATSPPVPILRSGVGRIDVVVRRDEGYEGTITVRPLWLPPGVTSSTLRLTGKKAEGTISLNANSRAAVGTWPLVLYASASIGGVTRATSTEPLTLQVDEPWITAKLPRARIELGKAGEFPIELERKREFDGEVKVELVRLPKGLEYEVPAIPDEDGAVVVALRADEQTRTGRHRSIYARLTIETATGTLTTTAGGGEVRVDAPLPPELRGDPDGGDR